MRVAAIESNSNVTIYAFHHPVTGRVTLVGRNAGSSNVTFSGTLANLPVVPSFELYHTTISVNMQRGTDVAGHRRNVLVRRFCQQRFHAVVRRDCGRGSAQRVGDGTAGRW